ncbi:MAG: protoporphyrin/coproporphyrin ferrochelatase [Frankiaceae bacterium]|jgi:ferrochelatase|nr:protoporphyrin/coproporphyrin ferrochelatase [Frankiaceae bacterium]
MTAYDAVLLVSFGGPAGPDDVMPFLRNVTAGRGIPDERLAEVAGHYHHFGGRSPINEQNRALLAELRRELAPRPVYWGNRNWDPFLTQALREMSEDGVQRAVCFFTAAYASYSSCRQYRENLADALREIGAPVLPAGSDRPASDGLDGDRPVDPGPLVLDKLRHFYNHPGFLEAQADRVRVALGELAEKVGPARAAQARLVFTAHSIPTAAAATSGPSGGAYDAQLREAAGLVAGMVGAADRWQLAFQSRSGAPSVPWLEPDVTELLPGLVAEGVPAVVLVPIGFVSDHLEVAFDLDVEAAERAVELSLPMVRAGTVGVHPRFVRMVRELVEERERGDVARPFLGDDGPSHDVCPATCCRPRILRQAAAGTAEDAGRAVAEAVRG